MRYFRYILFLIAWLFCYAYAQTPFDSFSPETSRPILELEPVASPDTILCASVVLSIDDTRKWLSVDPLSDKYPNISPYAYCGWNPMKHVDPDGRDWYEEEGGAATLWKNSNDASININGVTLKNIGENYHHIMGKITYGYHQNKLAFIEYTTNTKFYQQPTGTSCKVTCNLMVESAGYTPELGRTGEIIMATHDENGVVCGATRNWRQGVNRLDDYMLKGMPCVVGIDYKPLQQHNLTPNGDGMTDHFITIVGMRINIQEGTTFYRFYDPGSMRGASPSNVINLTGTFLQGKTAAYGSLFKVTTIRKNK